MKILFDQGVPAPLRHRLAEHAVHTAFERGWSDLENGALLAAAERRGYELLITTDQNLKYQQNLGGTEAGDPGSSFDFLASHPIEDQGYSSGCRSNCSRRI
jgi:hypothetical protein